MDLQDLLKCLLVSMVTFCANITSCISEVHVPKRAIIPFSVEKEELNCPTQKTKWLTDMKVPWGIEGRAWLTIPPEVTLRPSTIPKAGHGIFATTFIPRNMWLAEYEGEVLTVGTKTSEYAFKIPRNNVVYHKIDAYNIETSNWIRWINCARDASDENVRYMYCAGKVYYLTTRDIAPNTELLVYYGDHYAKTLGIHYKTGGNNLK